MLPFIKRILLIFFVISFSLKTTSQNTLQVDSLEQKSFEELADLFYNSKPDTTKAIIYANAVFKKALKEKDTLRMMSGKYYLADILDDETIYLIFCDSLIEKTKKTPSNNFPAAVFVDKANFFFHLNENSNALKELVQANAIIEKHPNDYLYNKTLYLTAAVKTSINQNEEALVLYKKVYDYVSQNKLIITDNFFSTLPLNLTIGYRNVKKNDSAYIYNKKAIELYKQIKDSVNLGYSYYSLGLILKNQEDYNASLEALLKSVPAIISDENYRILLSTYTNVAILYDSLKIPQKSFEYHLKTDSLHVIKNIHVPSLEKTYDYLYKYYKKDNSLKKQLLYLNKLLDIKEFKLREKNEINKTFSKEYDIPNLMSEKKKIIEKLENEVNESRKIKIVYIVLVTLLVILIGYQNKRKRTYKKRFLSLVNQEKSLKNQPKETLKSDNKNEISTEIVTSILKQLKSFEKNKEFINTDTSLQSLADKFETNTSYLSKVINQYKNTSFSNYINELRIEYTVEKLKKDTLWRKYTIKAIAAEVGFKSPEAFSKAFYKFTGIKPSYFIKELKKSTED